MMRSKLLATALICLMLLGISGSWHGEGDDPDFLPPATHDHSSHHETFRVPADPQGDAHCAICHWLQMFRASALRQARVHLDAGTLDARVVTAIPPIRLAALLDVPSRAPPA
jgi:hypothetical protein